MNLHYAKITELLSIDGMHSGKVRVGGAIKTVSMELLPQAQEGDEVLLCDGMAISRVENSNNELEQNHVPGNPR